MQQQDLAEAQRRPAATLVHFGDPRGEGFASPHGRELELQQRRGLDTRSEMLRIFRTGGHCVVSASVITTARNVTDDPRSAMPA
jgi:hypothetical protein